ncbi:hypothetical protein D9756_008340 [Leucocoprinus leucothites]|uniref:cellulase n=1 Tax=Leucocoprinus leucothites TaxID=201217 RepID=A0A8H5FVY3_9AGAR|nr:hypothetical protein D9756_008340 [Leucoagaricus leucothites]
MLPKIFSALLLSASISTALPSPHTPRQSQSLKFAGVNIAGFDFGCNSDGSCTASAAWPPLTKYYGADGLGQMQHFVKDDGFNIFRLPVGWQFLTNNVLGGPVVNANLAEYDDLVQACLSTGAWCIIDIHNYARWDRGIIGQGGPTDEEFAETWTTIAAKYKDESKIIFGIMNEPHDVPDIERWAQSVQAAVTAIRNAGATTQIILLPGNNWTSAETFVSNGSAAALSKVINPDGSTTNLIFDVHKYLDSDNSGTHAECVTNNIDNAWSPLADWLRENKRQALNTETGGGNTDSCVQFMCEQIAYQAANSDVFLGYVGWAAGNFLPGSYVLGETPTQSTSDGSWSDTLLVKSCVAPVADRDPLDQNGTMRILLIGRKIWTSQSSSSTKTISSCAEEAYPLPPNPYPTTTVWYNAYDICRQFERRTTQPAAPPSGLFELECARFLGYMVMEAPNDAGRENISKEIMSAADDAGLADLAKLYIGHSTHCFFLDEKDSLHNDIDYTLKRLLEEAPPNQSTAGKNALIRDQFRCMVSGFYDYDSVRYIPAAHEARQADLAHPGLSGRCVVTEAAHILPEGTETVFPDAQASEMADDYVASLSAVLERFGQVDPAELAGPAHHRLENIMTLHTEIHTFFDSLVVWFEPTSEPNEYIIGRADPTILLNSLPHTATVTFTSRCDELPLPNPRYLVLHAACARVVTFSGVYPYIIRLLDREDESSADVSEACTMPRL